ncbi:glucose-6-phosphate isomerase [Leptolyngbya sp. PCC 7375]|nr:glucose-6-phosphate isomerase [Leptolyngbya sp. PCC 7375]
MSEINGWRQFCKLWIELAELEFTLDMSCMGLSQDQVEQMRPALLHAITNMHTLEKGGIANPDEERMVGHYWLRDPSLAPTVEIKKDILDTLAKIHHFATAIRNGDIKGTGGSFEQIIHIGIGGSGLGPQLISKALASPTSSIDVHFLDNADPVSIDYLLERLGRNLDRTLVFVVSKSGWTPTPWHVMLEVEAAYERSGVDFSKHAVAVTMLGTKLDNRAKSQGWLERFPVWEWVGGRTSVTSSVGLLPVAVQGISIDALLYGAATMDSLTRSPDIYKNPAALMALSWYVCGNGHGDKNMVVLPYRDCLSILPMYIRQLVMESVGKRLDRDGRVVHQGLTVYGNKGSTDQHSYVQQLRDGRNDFFVNFVYCHEERHGASVPVESEATLEDYLFGYLEGTRNALYDRGRNSFTINIPRIDAVSMGALIALYERAVGIYAELIDVNAYHQPGVDKDAAGTVVNLQKQVLAHLRTSGSARTAEEIAVDINSPERADAIYRILRHLSRNSHRGVSISDDPAPDTARFLVENS